MILFIDNFLHIFLKKLTNLPDAIQYEFFVLISSSKLKRPIDFDLEMLDYIKLQCNNEQNIQKLLKCFNILLSRQQNNKKLSKFIEYLFNKRSLNISQSFLSDALLKKILITPNLILFNSKSGEDSNRIQNTKFE